MGFLSKMFGLGGKGTIDVIVDKPYYISGELVAGSLLVQVFEPIDCNEVVIIVSGNEVVRWPASNSRYEDLSDYIREDEFLQEKVLIKLILFNVQQQIPPGNYVYPFEYILPNDLPGSFDNKKDNGVVAKITYSITGTLSIDGMLTKDLSKTIPLNVYEQWNGEIASISNEKSVDVKLLELFNKGKCNLRIALDKNVYEPNEIVMIHCNILNQAKKGVKSIQFDLIQTVKANIRTYCTLAKIMCTATFPGTPASSEISQVFSFQLKDDGLYPSTHGQVLTCSYRIEMTCTIPFCPDIILALPITITMPSHVPSELYE
ncbi:hypothetical protein THRCLA_05287 [Thraustotheca clavata]|uniref:Arrestin C-terminal-like domain-containing protein n=1 Tax=Thraustotheca clavata TaxID=74557 RepID=A0A1V9ZWE4_9STRA|nr:hypothetical protein THRCLA_05287 [Thraustotheca clavata]